MLGCASVPMSDGGHYAASLHRLFSEKFLAPIEYHAFPRTRLPVENLNQSLDVEPPALIKAICAWARRSAASRHGTRTSTWLTS